MTSLSFALIAASLGFLWGWLERRAARVEAGYAMVCRGCERTSVVVPIAQAAISVGVLGIVLLALLEVGWRSSALTLIAWVVGAVLVPPPRLG